MTKIHILISVFIVTLAFSLLGATSLSASHGLSELECRETYPTNTPERDLCIEHANQRDPLTTGDECNVPDGAPVPVGCQFAADYNDDLGEENKIITRLQQIINFLSIGVGIVVTGSVVVAGIQWSAARGNPQATQKAVQRLWSAGIALALFVFMWVILNWLIPGGPL